MMTIKHFTLGVLPFVASLVFNVSFAQPTNHNTPKNEDDFEIVFGYAEGQKLEISNFKGSIGIGTITLTWDYAPSSTAAQPIIVQYSRNGQKFKNLGNVFSPVGFEETLWTYQVTQFQEGFNFFRLAQPQTGMDTLYTDVKTIIVGQLKNHVLSIEPIPTGKRLTLQVMNDQQVEITISKEGKQVRSLFKKDMIANEIVFRDITLTSTLEPGTYFLVIQGDGFKETVKVEIP